MNRILFFLLISLFCCSCNNYENKDKYEINIGDTIEIYYSTNSCCYYCISNEKDLKLIKLLKTKTIKSAKTDCDGCNTKYAFVFKAESTGTETIELKFLEKTIDCKTDDVISEKYIVEIK